MKNQVFESLVKNNGVITRVNRKNEKLVTKEQFIDDLLTTEQVDNIQDCLQDFTKVRAEYNTEWSVLRFYCRAIQGLQDAIFLEMTVKTLTNVRDTDNERLEQLKEEKIRYISDFANYLFK